MSIHRLPTLVLTDFDGTLTKHDTFPLFLRFALGKSFFFRLPAIAWYVLLMKLKVLSAQRAKERILALAFQGWERERLQRTGKAFIMRLLKNESAAFRPGALDMLRRRRQEGIRILVVSASPEEWVAPFAQAMGAECIATRLEYDEQGFTGKLAGKNCTGEEKVRRITELIPNISTHSTEAYGDSPGDSPMLNMAQQTFYKPFRKQRG